MKYMKMVDLEKFVNAYPKELSGGMKQRVAIARAYAVNPSLLLMDEPFGALDTQTRTQLQTELLKTWEEGKKACFFITHDVEESILLASKVVVMSARPGHIKEIIDIGIPYPRTHIANGEVYREHRFELLTLHVKNGKICFCSRDEVPLGARIVDAAGLKIVPGFIDIHTHGAVEVDVNAVSAEDLQKIGRFFASNGTTVWMGSILTDTVEQTEW